VLAVAYAIQIEELREQVSTAQLAAALTRAMGGEAQSPDAWRARADFDAALSAVPEQVANPDEYVLKQALGLR
jgi:hypothetical protein